MSAASSADAGGSDILKGTETGIAGSLRILVTAALPVQSKSLLKVLLDYVGKKGRKHCLTPW